MSEDKIHLEDVLQVSKYINNLLSPVFDTWFTFCSNIHKYWRNVQTIFPNNSYGKTSITVSAIKSWNKTKLSDVTIKKIKFKCH